MFIKEIALDLTVFTLSNVNDAISFKPQLCFEVPKQDYQALKENYINFTGTSIRKNRSRLYFLPTNVSDELQKLNPSIPEDAKIVPNDGRVYYKNRLISELDYENVKRVETACAFIAYTALNSFVHFETEQVQRKSSYPIAGKSSQIAHNHLNINHSRSGNKSTDTSTDNDTGDEDDGSPSESVHKALRKGNILGFRELGHLVGITPWHFHRVFKVITGLTIREYGQLCVEFIKKNQEIIDTCKIKVEQIKSKQPFSCLDDDDFLKDGSIQYAATEDVVLLHEYFIDPNKSKEFKTRKSSNNSNNITNGNNNSNVNNSNANSTFDSSRNIDGDTKNAGSLNNTSDFNSSNISRSASTGSTAVNREGLIQVNQTNSNQLSGSSNGNRNGSEDTSPTSQRSEIRKRRSSVMYGRMQRAAQNSITSNSLLYECLTSPPADLKLSEYCLTNGSTDVDNDNGNDTDTSAASSVWEHQNMNMFPLAHPVRSVSPSISSRKNSIISLERASASVIAPKPQTNSKISKRKSISSGTNLDGLQSSMLHRRNRSDGGTMSLSMEPLQTDLSLDSRLSLSPREYPVEFNSNVFNSLQSATAAATAAANSGCSNINPMDEDTVLGDGGIDFRLNDGSVDYNLPNMSSGMPLTNSDTNVMTNPASMTDISLFDNSLLDQPTPNTASAMNLLLDTGPLPLPGSLNNSYKIKDEDIQLEAILSGANTLDGVLTPSTATIINPIENNGLSGFSAMVPKDSKTQGFGNFKTDSSTIEPAESDLKAKDQIGANYFFNTVVNGVDDDGVLFDTALTSANDTFLLPRDSGHQRTTTMNTTSNEPSAYDF